MLQSYRFLVVDAYGRRHEAVGTGNTLGAAAKAVALHAAEEWGGQPRSMELIELLTDG